MTLHFNERVEVRRRTGYRDDHGEWQEGTPATRTIRANIYPDEGERRVITFAGLRRTVKWTLLTPDTIRGLETGDDSDEVRIGGEWLRTYLIRRFPKVGKLPAHNEVGALAGQ